MWKEAVMALYEVFFFGICLKGVEINKEGRGEDGWSLVRDVKSALLKDETGMLPTGA